MAQNNSFDCNWELETDKLYGVDRDYLWNGAPSSDALEVVGVYAKRVAAAINCSEYDAIEYSTVINGEIEFHMIGASTVDNSADFVSFGNADVISVKRASTVDGMTLTPGVWVRNSEDYYVSHIITLKIVDPKEVPEHIHTYLSNGTRTLHMADIATKEDLVHEHDHLSDGNTVLKMSEIALKSELTVHTSISAEHDGQGHVTLNGLNVRHDGVGNVTLF